MFQTKLPHFTQFTGMACPYCGGETLCPSPRDLSLMVELSEHEEILYEITREFAGKPETDGLAGFQKHVFDRLFCYDPNGGPEPGQMYFAARAALNGLNTKARPFGITLSCTFRDGVALGLLPNLNAWSAPAPFAGKSGGHRQHFRPLPCPCCTRNMGRPNLEQVMHHYRLQPRERQFLRAINAAPGGIATNEWLYATCFTDDAKPRASTERYSALKVALSYARGKLRGSGVVIKNLGYRQGWVIASEVTA